MNGNSLNALGAMVAGLRIQNHLTQEQLATRVGTTRQTIARIESGRGGKVAFQTWMEVINELSYHLNIERDVLILENGLKIPDNYHDPMDDYVDWLHEEA